MKHAYSIATLLILVCGLSGLAMAAAPPDRLNYQGVLRDDTGAPLDGMYEMVFRFFDAAAAGNELLVDDRTGANEVTVTGGLFNVSLGGATVSTGSGTGAVSSLAELFRDFSDVYMEVEITGMSGAETLSPRIPIASTAYAFNAGHLDGLDSGSFWQPGNDGPGSGLDADTLDGIDSTGFLARNAQDTSTATVAGGSLYTFTNDAVGTNSVGLTAQIDVNSVANGVFTGVAASSSRNDTVDDGSSVSNRGVTATASGASGTAGALAINYGIQAIAAGNELGGTVINHGVWSEAGGVGDSTKYGVLSKTSGSGSGTHYGVHATAGGTGGGTHYGVFATATGGSTNWGLYTPINSFVGGDLDVSGDIDVGGTLTGDGSGLGNVTASNAALLDGIDSSAFLRSNVDDIATQRITFTKVPTGTGIGSGPLYIDAPNAIANHTLLGVALVGAERMRLDAEGDISISGTITTGTGTSSFGRVFIIGNELEFNHGPRIFAPATHIFIQGGTDPTDDVFLRANVGDANDGQLLINGSASFDMRAGNGNFQFFNGTGTETADLDTSGNLQIDGDLTLGTESTIDNAGAGDFIIRKDLDNNSASWFRIFEDNNTVEQMRIGSGNEAAANFDGAVNANGLDYAEAFKILDPTLAPGEVVTLMADRAGFVERSGVAYSQQLVGVVSGKPGFVTGDSFDAEEAADPEMAAARDRAQEDGDIEIARAYTMQLIGKKKEQQRPVALLGRLPVKVDGAHGPIHAGDHLTSSPTPGHAMAMEQSGPSLGIALEGFSDEGRGEILVFVNPGMYAPSGGIETTRQAQQELAGQLEARTPDPHTGIQSVPGHLQVSLDADANDQARFSILSNGQSGIGSEVFRVDEAGNVYSKGALRPASMDVAEYFGLSEPAEPGDVLVADREAPGKLTLGRAAADPAVVGIVAREPGVLLGSGIERIVAADAELAADLAETRRVGDRRQEAELWDRLVADFEETHAAVALTGTVSCKVDAGYGSIRVGDLLTTSPTPGHAMRSDDALPGTIVGKALEPLENGTGSIRVVVMLR